MNDRVVNQGRAALRLSETLGVTVIESEALKAEILGRLIVLVYMLRLEGWADIFFDVEDVAGAGNAERCVTVKVLKDGASPKADPFTGVAMGAMYSTKHAGETAVNHARACLTVLDRMIRHAVVRACDKVMQ